MQNLSHSASFDSEDKNAPSKPGIKQFIGGTLLTGGVGLVAGTFVGILLQGLIQTYIVFDGTLSSW